MPMLGSCGDSVLHRIVTGATPTWSPLLSVNFRELVLGWLAVLGVIDTSDSESRRIFFCTGAN